MGGTCSMPGGRLEMDTNCWLEDLKVRYHFGNLDVDGRGG